MTLEVVGLCLRAAEPLAGGWTAVENICQRIRELACSLYPNGDRLSSCVYYHLNIPSNESTSSHQPQSWLTLRKRSRSAS
jgi:hypothetical protein